MRRARAAIAVLAALAVVPGRAGAQSGAGNTSASPGALVAPHDVRECWRFGFGPWQPALDWKGAGHAGRSPEDYLASAASGTAARPAMPGGASWSSAAGDTALLLFPDWWPAGVAVRLEPAPASADTIRGTATALVADGHVRNPVSRITAIRRRCDAREGR